MSLVVERNPIDLSTLPENIHKHLDPDAPEPLKMMAARGMLPVPPEQNITILYALGTGADDDVAEEARTSLEGMPSDIVVPALQQLKHEGVLDWATEIRRNDPHALDAIVTNRATHHHTIARVARMAGPNLCDVIATNQVRILEAPVILEEMYKNPHARMATVDRLVELAQREGVQLKGLPGVQNAIQSGQDVFGKAEDSEEKRQLFRQEAQKGDVEDRKLEQLDELTRAEREQLLEEEENEAKRSSGMMSEKISRMSISEKIRLATIGGREALNVLIRDPNKLVHMAAAKSPRIQYPDIKKWSNNKTLPDNVIAYIAGQRDYTRHYEVMLNLCGNPKTPLSSTLKFLNHLRSNDLKQLASDRTVPMQVSRQAKQLHKKRSGRS